MTAHNIFETISSQYFQLTNSEKKVADYVLRHRIDVQYMSISEPTRLGMISYAVFCLKKKKKKKKTTNI